MDPRLAGAGRVRGGAAGRARCVSSCSRAGAALPARPDGAGREAAARSENKGVYFLKNIRAKKPTK